MIYYTFPTKDATIYDYSQSLNTGRDQLLEVTKITDSPDFVGTRRSRALIQFNWAVDRKKINDTFSSFSTAETANKVEYRLKLHTAEAIAIPYSYNLEVGRLGESWEMGIGKLDHNPPTEKGVSWKWKTVSGSDPWSIAGGAFSTYTNQTQSFEFESSDLDIPISESIAIWNTTPALNHGLIVRYSSSLEADSLSYGKVQFFSMDTNTIYSPKMSIAWDDSVWQTGSLSQLTTDEILVYVKNGKYEYHEGEIARFEIRARDIFPTQTYGTSSAALVTKYLPTSSYWAIEDAETEEKVIDFNSDYTKLSCATTGNFFNFPMDNLISERLYKIVIKVDGRVWDGQTEYFDVNQVFKVVR